MRVLLASLHTDEGKQKIGGVQTWNRTILRELVRRGHEVVQCEPRSLSRIKGEFHFGIVANITKFPDGIEHRCMRTVGVSHGIIPAERPVPELVDRQCFVSEEVRMHWRGQGDIVRQPIDLAFWMPGSESEPRQLMLRHSYRQEDALSRKLAARLRLQYAETGRRSPEEVRRLLRRSALVLATGRAAVEAMACGAPTVIYDHRRDYQGPLLDSRWTGLAAQSNYSGRVLGADQRAPTLDELETCARKAISFMPQYWRAWARTNHDSVVVAAKLLKGVPC